MKKTLTALVAVSALAAAGLAQADAIFYPDGRVVELGDSSVESLALDESSTMDIAPVDTTVLGASSDPLLDTPIDTTVMGAPSSTLSSSTTTTVQVPQLVYVQPNIDFDRATVLSQLHNRNLVIRDHRIVSSTDTRDTFNVPQRAGEASTMTGGVPNLVTDNSIVVGGLTIPHTVVSVDQPYYVLSF
jgi:hypothetical protein